MKNIVLLFLVALLFSGCITSSLKLNTSDDLVLKYNENELILTNKILDSKFLNFKDLFVTKYKLQDKDKRILFYEDARTEINFEFNYSDINTLLLIFGDINKYEVIYERRNLRFIQLQLKDKTNVNVMYQASDTQAITYVYGFSNHEFIKKAKEISGDDEVDIKKLKLQGQTFTPSSEPLTNWNDKMVFFAPLITPLRGMRR